MTDIIVMYLVRKNQVSDNVQSIDKTYHHLGVQSPVLNHTSTCNYNYSK
jgi:hypothetical protein